jgi:hypothetical protein
MMSVNKDYIVIPMEILNQVGNDGESGELDDNDQVIQELAQANFCSKVCVVKGLVKGSVTTLGALGGTLLGLIPPVICLAIAYFGIHLSGTNTLALGHHSDDDITKISIGVIITLGAGFVMMLTALTTPIYGCVKGGVMGWKKGEELAKKNFPDHELIEELD